MDDREAQINEIIRKFNFERVHIAMKTLDWQWIVPNGAKLEVPSIERMKEKARHLLRNAVIHKCTGSGGFEAKYHPQVDGDPEYFELKFVLHHACSYDD